MYVAYVVAVWRNNKRKLQQCCLDAVFFITIPKLDDDTETGDEDEQCDSVFCV